MGRMPPMAMQNPWAAANMNFMPEARYRVGFSGSISTGNTGIYGDYQTNRTKQCQFTKGTSCRVLGSREPRVW
jgi:hypothetical protein